MFDFLFNKTFLIKGTVVQIEKALINDYLLSQNYPENFSFQLLTILQ